MPVILLYLGLGVVLVLVLDRVLRAYSCMTAEEAKQTGFWTAGIGLTLVSLVSPVFRRLAMLGLLAAPWHWNKADEVAGKPGAAMSETEARSVLDVGPQAGAEEIEEAYRALMRKYHPDQGGSEYFAKKLNEARDVLLKGKP